MDKRVCITGTDRGLGYELVKMYLTDGDIVFAGFYDETNQLEVLKKNYKDQLNIVKMDISDSDSVRMAASEIESLTDKLDILINNAAILGDIESTIFDNIDLDEIKRVFDVNVIGSLRVTNTLINLITKSRKPLIINISSEAGSIEENQRNSWFGYCISKAAMNMEASLIHNSLKDIDGQVMAIHPGWMKTYMRGSLDTNATYTPMESAEKIFKIIGEHEIYKGDKPAFIDCHGSYLKW